MCLKTLQTQKQTTTQLVLSEFEVMFSQNILLT